MFRIGIFNAPTSKGVKSDYKLSYSTSLLMATMKSLGWETFYRACSSCVFVCLWSNRQAMSARSRCSHIGLVCLSNALFDWFKQCVIRYHYLVLQDWYRLKLHMSIKRTSVHWRALCVVCSCVMHCTVAVWLLLVSCTLFFSLLPGGIRISVVMSFRNIVLLYGKRLRQCFLFPLCHLSLIWLSVVFDLLPLLLLCL